MVEQQANVERAKNIIIQAVNKGKIDPIITIH